MFICKGALFKKEYLEEAVSRGSICYVSERDYGLEQVPRILVKNIREAMPLLAEKFYQVSGRDAEVYRSYGYEREDYNYVLHQGDF